MEAPAIQSMGTLVAAAKNCDATYTEALNAGARSLQQPTDQFYGDRNARFEDPFGNEWSVMTHIKHVQEREMKKAMAQNGKRRLIVATHRKSVAYYAAVPGD